MSVKPKGTYRVSQGCSCNAQHPGRRTPELLLPGTLVPRWVPDKALKDWIMSGHVTLVGQMNVADSDVEKSQKEADIRPIHDAPGVDTTTHQLEQDEVGSKGGDSLMHEPKGRQPQTAASQHDVENLRLVGEAEEREAVRQQEDEQRALSTAAPSPALATAPVEPAPAPEQESTKVSVAMPDVAATVEAPAEASAAAPVAPETKPEGTAPQETIGRFVVAAEQLEGKNIDELNTMVLERMNQTEAESFRPYETVQEAAAHLGMDLKSK